MHQPIRILVVEDDTNVSAVLTARLESLDYQVCGTAETGPRHPRLSRRRPATGRAPCSMQLRDGGRQVPMPSRGSGVWRRTTCRATRCHSCRRISFSSATCSALWSKVNSSGPEIALAAPLPYCGCPPPEDNPGCFLSPVRGPVRSSGPKRPADKRIDRDATKNVSLKSFGYGYQNGSG